MCLAWNRKLVQGILLHQKLHWKFVLGQRKLWTYLTVSKKVDKEKLQRPAQSPDIMWNEIWWPSILEENLKWTGPVVFKLCDQTHTYTYIHTHLITIPLKDSRLHRHCLWHAVTSCQCELTRSDMTAQATFILSFFITFFFPLTLFCCCSSIYSLAPGGS